MQFLYSSILGAIAGWSIYQLAILSSFIGSNDLIQFLCPTIGALGGIALVNYLYLKKKTIYKTLNKRLWFLPFLHANLFFGVSLGLVVGSFSMGLMLIPFSYIFGHPEAQEWSSQTTLIFSLISGIIVFAITLSSSIYFVKSGSSFLERKYNIT